MTAQQTKGTKNNNTAWDNRTRFVVYGQGFLFIVAWTIALGRAIGDRFWNPKLNNEKMEAMMESEAVPQGYIYLVKYFFDVSMDVQRERFQKRISDPMRHWKLSPMDTESYQRWWDYTEAYADMIHASDTDWAPWFRVDADDKRRARLNCIAHLLTQIPYRKLPFKAPDLGKRKRRRKAAPELVPFAHRVPRVY